MSGDGSKTTIWFTKYALTTGIIRVDDAVFEADGYVCAQIGGRRTWICRRDWFLTEAEAQAKARAMAQRKISAIDKQKARLLILASGPVRIKTAQAAPPDTHRGGGVDEW